LSSRKYGKANSAQKIAAPAYTGLRPMRSDRIDQTGTMTNWAQVATVTDSRAVVREKPSWLLR